MHSSEFENTEIQIIDEDESPLNEEDESVFFQQPNKRQYVRRAERSSLRVIQGEQELELIKNVRSHERLARLEPALRLSPDRKSQIVLTNFRELELEFDENLLSYNHEEFGEYLVDEIHNVRVMDINDRSTYSFQQNATITDLTKLDK